ncbi:hypothetical protein WA158_002199 [Blastocystis sp. Blastoise]
MSVSMFGDSYIQSKEPPKPEEIELTNKLDTFFRSQNLYETKEEYEHRKSVLDSLSKVCQEWVQAVIKAKNPTFNIGNKQLCVLYTFGSFSLNVHSPNADIDTLCVGPHLVTREDFFEILTPKLKELPDVTEVNPIVDAKTPIITMNFRGVDIDLLYASIPRYECEIPDDFDISDDMNLKGLDEFGLRTVNGRRVANTLLKLVPNQSQFRIALKAIKLWCSKRGVEKNVFGYFGGVNCALLVARISQRYPTASAVTLLEKFFEEYSSWPWPKPLTLYNVPMNTIHNFDSLVWDPAQNPIQKNEIFPLITPAYPCMNSTKNVIESTKKVIMKEFERGNNIMKQIINKKIEWNILFEPSDFFEQYKYYMMISIYSDTKELQSKWQGFVESRILKGLVINLENTNYVTPHLFPHPYPLLKTETTPEGTCYFVGLDISLPSDNNNTLNLSYATQTFLSGLKINQEDGMHVTLKTLRHTKKICELPENVYQPKEHSRKRKHRSNENDSKKTKTN